MRAQQGNERVVGESMLNVNNSTSRTISQFGNLHVLSYTHLFTVSILCDNSVLRILSFDQQLPLTSIYVIREDASDPRCP